LTSDEPPGNNIKSPIEPFRGYPRWEQENS
jgi:hypothetical protein